MSERVGRASGARNAIVLNGHSLTCLLGDKSILIFMNMILLSSSLHSPCVHALRRKLFSEISGFQCYYYECIYIAITSTNTSLHARA